MSMRLEEKRFGEYLNDQGLSISQIDKSPLSDSLYFAVYGALDKPDEDLSCLFSDHCARGHFKTGQDVDVIFSDAPSDGDWNSEELWDCFIKAVFRVAENIEESYPGEE